MSTLHSGTLGGKGAAGGLQRRQETNDAALSFLTPPVSMPIALATLRGLHQLTIPATSATKGLPSSFLPSALHSLLFKKVDDIYADHRFIEYQPALYLSTNTSKNSKKRRDETRRPSALPAKRVSVLAGRKRSRKTAIVFIRSTIRLADLATFYECRHTEISPRDVGDRRVCGRRNLSSIVFIDYTDIYSSPLLSFKIEEEGQSEKLKQEMNSLYVCSLLCHLLA
ncbi:hypothetical protein BLNAU_4984 [Blattamonas nauphoetae]|uniref:Uncharacterized protein n=1 Tax=Blattamonas nauphoetae TaxID=2049346 RepID=A0ABQ9Y8K6_9EUKA|nr:hypothetical protein BLNAU_4984 [Blattamonas nauphoetae]